MTVLAALLLTACSRAITLTPIGQTPSESTDAPPPATRTSAPPAITPLFTAQPDDTGWQPLAAGLELRRLLVRDAQGAADRLWLARVSGEALGRLAVAYAPQRPRRIGEWGDALPDVQLVVNANYFTADYRATGLLVSDGVAYGTSFSGAGGMLAVRGGAAEVRWLREQPVFPGETFDQAVQGWPMLLGPGGIPAYTEADRQVSRRTAAGLDRAGRVVFVVSPGLFFTLHDMAAWLAESDLDLEVAFNLDGGQSTGLWLDPALGAGQVDSFAAVPAVMVLRK